MHFLSFRLSRPYPANAIMFDLSDGYRVETILDNIFRSKSKVLDATAVVVFRLPVWKNVAPKKSFSKAELVQSGISTGRKDNPFSRVRGKPVYIIGTHDFHHWVSDNVNSTCTHDAFQLGAVETNKFLKLLRKSEIDHLISEGGAVLPEVNDDTLYLAPSGSYQKSFLRVGNIQYSQAALDSLFFWLLPELEQCCAIMTETWSISSTALNCSRRLAAYKGSKTPCPVEMLPSYDWYRDVGDIEAADHIERFMRRSFRYHGGAKSEIIFLMSAINSGGFYKRICDRLLERGYDMSRIHFVLILNLGEHRAELPCLRDLSAAADDGRFAPVGVQNERRDKFNIRINARSYFPSYYTDVLHSIKKRDAAPFLRLVRKYPLAELVKVHKDVFEGGLRRHHALWIDTGALIDTATFQRDLRKHLTSLSPRPTLVVTPLHSAAGRLAKIAIDAFKADGREIEHVAHPNLYIGEARREDAGVHEKIAKVNPETESIVILDDAYITGRRLSVYQNNLRTTPFTGVVHYIVAIARPEDEVLWNEQSEMLAYRPDGWPLPNIRNSVKAIETTPLPNWGVENCPWCEELRFYSKASRISRGESLPYKYAVRQSRLQDIRNEGMIDELFLAPDERGLNLTPKSIFQPVKHTEALFFAAVASAIQKHRSASFAGLPFLGERRYPVATILSFREYLVRVFTDSFIRACFLRSARSYELIPTEDSEEQKRISAARALITSDIPTEYDITVELLLANALDKFAKVGSIVPSDVVLSRFGEEVSLFRKISVMATGEQLGESEIIEQV